jgi:hypothetical protein
LAEDDALTRLAPIPKIKSGYRTASTICTIKFG